MALSLIDEDAAAQQVGDWLGYVRRKIGNHDEVRLVQEPASVLTPLFLSELETIADRRQVVLFFDTFERTSAFLEPGIDPVSALTQR